MNLTRVAILCAAFLFASLPVAQAAEIPADFDRSPTDAASALQSAGLPAEEARVRAASMDPVELTEFSHSDPRQQGGSLSRDEQQLLYLFVSVLAVLLVVAAA